MRLTLPRQKLYPIATVLLIAVFLVSCGSYQQASYYEDDGIYATGNRVVRVEKKSAEAVAAEQQEKNMYGEYFGQRAQQYEEILDSEIFTDVDSYYSGVENDSLQIGEQTDYFADKNDYVGNPGWGDNPTNLTINIYDNSWGWSDPWLWNAGWGWGYAGYYGWGWNNWGCVAS